LDASGNARAVAGTIRASLSKLTLNDWKSLVEIAAILVAGSWVVYEHVYQEGKARRRGEENGWVAVTLVGASTPLSDGQRLIHANVTLTNTSKRAVEPMFVSWVLEDPTRVDAEKVPVRTIKNTTRVVTVRPGESTQDSTTFLAPREQDVALLRVRTYLRSEVDEEICVFDTTRMPEAARPDFEVTKYTKVPAVCTPPAGSTSRTADSPGCPYQRAEVLLDLRQPKQPSKEEKAQ
jgi:hypothetical protein